MESMRFAGSVGALSQSPDSYRPVQKMNSLTWRLTTAEVREIRMDRLKGHDAREEVEVLRLDPYGMRRSLRLMLMPPPEKQTMLVPAST